MNAVHFLPSNLVAFEIWIEVHLAVEPNPDWLFDEAEWHSIDSSLSRCESLKTFKLKFSYESLVQPAAQTGGAPDANQRLSKLLPWCIGLSHVYFDFLFPPKLTCDREADGGLFRYHVRRDSPTLVARLPIMNLSCFCS